MGRPIDLKTRFWSKVNKDGTIVSYIGTSCWTWTASKNKDGYGFFQLQNRSQLAHRVSWMMEHGRFPVGTMQVLHRCDNPACVRPDHLFSGTRSDNMRDCESKGRRRRARGVEHANAKMNDQKVREARRLRADGVSLRKIGELLGVSGDRIDKIVRWLAWKHVV